MLIEHFDIKPLSASQCLLSWESEAEDVVSWIFINGRFYLGPFMAGTKKRSMAIPFSATRTQVVEIHDFFGTETMPEAVEIAPLVRPGIAWNAVPEAVKYRLYHEPGGETEIRRGDFPALSTDRMEIDCPVKLEGRGGRWHRFRVESLDRYGKESESGGQAIHYFAADLPDIVQINILRDPATGLFTFSIGE